MHNAFTKKAKQVYVVDEYGRKIQNKGDTHQFQVLTQAMEMRYYYRFDDLIYSQDSSNKQPVDDAYLVMLGLTTAEALKAGVPEQAVRMGSSTGISTCGESTPTSFPTAIARATPIAGA